MSIAATIGAVGAVAGGTIGAVGASSAAGAQSSAANNAAQLQYQLGQQSLAQNQKQFDITQQNLAPFLKAGTSGINTLSQLLSKPGQGLLTPFTGTFAAPSAAAARATPGYDFLAGAGSGAIQNSAAAGGNLLSTGTLKTLAQFNQGLADTTYSETYNRAFNEYLQQYNQFQNNQTNEFNRLASISGLGQQTGTTLGNLGQQFANTGANINLTTGQQVGSNINLAGAANASGYAGIANALNSGIGGATSNINQYLLLQQLLGGNLTAQGGAPGTVPGLGAGYTPPDAVATPPIVQVPG